MSNTSRDIIDSIMRVNTCAYMLTIIVGIIGNIWVAWKVGVILLFDRSSFVQRQILYCIFVICCADLLMLCNLSLLVHFQIIKQWMFGDSICKLFYCIEVMNKVLIPVALVHISRASYRSVNIRPVDVVNDHCHGCVLIVNILAVCIVLILMVFVGYFSNTNTHWVRGQSMTVCTFHPPTDYEIAFNLIAFLVGYIMTSVAYVYFYANVPIVLKRRYSTAVTSRQFINNQSILRIRRTVTVFVVVYLVCWTPYWVLFWFLSIVHILTRWMVVVSAFTHLLPYIACTAYPIILTAMNKEIHNTHSLIIDNKRRQLSTMRHGALQTMMTQTSLFQPWTRLVIIQKKHSVT